MLLIEILKGISANFTHESVFTGLVELLYTV